MQYVIVEIVNGFTIETTCIGLDALHTAMELDQSRCIGSIERWHRKVELRGAPRFKGHYGPFFMRSRYHRPAIVYERKLAFVARAAA